MPILWLRKDKPTNKAKEMSEQNNLAKAPVAKKEAFKGKSLQKGK
jgi:hypothetical protein